jgi:flagellar protein FlhE
MSKPQLPQLAASVLCIIGGLWSCVTSAQIRVDRNLSISAPGKATVNIPQETATTMAPATSAPAGPSGSYVAEAMGPNIVAHNADYVTTFSIRSSVPAGSRITKVSWRYGMSALVHGFEAVICWNDEQPCWNVTDSTSGSTQGFNGKDASRPFTLHYRVKGGSQPGLPLQGKMNQLIVSYQLP